MWKQIGKNCMGRLKAVFGIDVAGDGFYGALCGEVLSANSAIVAYLSDVKCLVRVRSRGHTGICCVQPRPLRMC